MLEPGTALPRLLSIEATMDEIRGFIVLAAITTSLVFIILMNARVARCGGCGKDATAERWRMAGGICPRCRDPQQKPYETGRYEL